MSGLKHVCFEILSDLSPPFCLPPSPACNQTSPRRSAPPLLLCGYQNSRFRSASPGAAAEERRRLRRRRREEMVVKARIERTAARASDVRGARVTETCTHLRYDFQIKGFILILAAATAQHPRHVMSAVPCSTSLVAQTK